MSNCSLDGKTWQALENVITVDYTGVALLGKQL